MSEPAYVSSASHEQHSGEGLMHRLTLAQGVLSPEVNPPEAAEAAQCPLGKMGVMSELVAILPGWETSGWKF